MSSPHDAREAAQEAAKQEAMTVLNRNFSSTELEELLAEEHDGMSTIGWLVQDFAATLLAREARGERRGIERAIEKAQSYADAMDMSPYFSHDPQLVVAALRSLLEPTTPTTEQKDAK